MSITGSPSPHRWSSRSASTSPMRWPDCRPRPDRARPARTSNTDERTTDRTTHRRPPDGSQTRGPQRRDRFRHRLSHHPLGRHRPSRSGRSRSPPESSPNTPRRIEKTQPDLQRLRGRRWRAGPRRRQGARRHAPAAPAAADPGPLAGIPIGVKDLQDAHRLHHHLRIRPAPGRPPGHHRQRLRRPAQAAGCIVVGKTNTPEFGWMGNTTNAIFGPTLNPFDTTERVRRLLGWGSRRPRRRHGPPRHGIRRRRLHPHPVGLLRPLGDEALPRACPRRRPHAPRLDRPLHRRPHGPSHRRRHPGPRRHRRPRPDRPAAASLAPKPRGSPRRGSPRPGAHRLRARPSGTPTVDAEVRAACDEAVELMASIGSRRHRSGFRFCMPTPSGISSP